MKNFNIFRKTLSVFSLLSVIFSFAQTAIKITYYTGTTQDYNIDTTGKLYFSGSSLMVKTSSTANNVLIPTSIIRKITFTSTSLATQETGQKKSQIRLYPNPASDFIKVSSVRKEKMNVRIYSSTGSLVINGIFQPDQEINISSLTPGFYLVQVNETTLKMIKK